MRSHAYFHSLIRHSRVVGHASIGPRVVYSARHDGMCSYVSRVLKPLWDSPIAKAGASQQIDTLISLDVLRQLSQDLKSIHRFLEVISPTFAHEP